MMKSLLSTLLLLCTLVSVNAVPVVPLSTTDIKAKSAQGLRLLTLAEGVAPVWKTESEVLDLIRGGKKFFDVTETYEVELKIASARTSGDVSIQQTYAAPSHQTAVKAILATMTSANMQTYLTTLTAFNNRYYKSATGASASTWIANTAKDIATKYGRTDVEVSLFAHSFVQSSIIVRIPGTNTANPRVLLGAHMDSINLSNPTSGRAPGADDDGTGTVNLLEAYRALLQGNFRPTSTVEFQFYAAEEAGLLGSQAIATKYKNDGVAVRGHYQLDMTGYFKPGTKEVMALAPDYIDSSLNEFTKLLITAYASIPWGTDLACGYACSDHASFNKVGYPTTYPFEAVTGNDNQLIHSASDTTSVSGFSWSHSLEFAKVAAAFAYELGI
ncbi:Zn-dependent exopeptidase [Ephemerocybe angulata]|uniref:Peptide hydrolase n=1 Tax=Ephemerocybe angulata TaxID=980116 RepID=A0A8H6HUY9_9AGAR|nr:Zn-dependent exopeptidase [Tulosesus angulatus]